MELSDQQKRMLAGGDGAGRQLAMRMVTKAAEALAAPRLIDIQSAHVTSCFYSGKVNVDFAEHLVANGAKVAVPTTLNASSMDFVHRDLQLVDPDEAVITGAGRLRECFQAMGCNLTWTCAPYHLEPRPGFGQHIAGSESNAVVFSNAVLGARTNLYGDFLDICAAITGCVPDAGLHRDEHRRGEILFELDAIPSQLLHEDIFFNVLGYLIGREVGSQIPVLSGLPTTTTEDQLRAVASTAACAGAVKHFHAVGITPEAPTLEAAFGGGQPVRTVRISPAQVVAARDALCTTTTDGELSAVCMGTPHFSVTEFEALTPMLAKRQVHPSVRFYVSTSRYVLDAIREKGWLPVYEESGVKIVVDRCTYNIPKLDGCGGRVMTSSAKWAYYAPGNVGAQVIFASLKECVDSAIAGHVVCDEALWAGVAGAER